MRDSVAVTLPPSYVRRQIAKVKNFTSRSICLSYWIFVVSPQHCEVFHLSPLSFLLWTN